MRKSKDPNLKVAKVLKKLRKDLPKLEQLFGVKRIAVFGSFARGEERPDSDIDILVKVDLGMGLFEFIELQQHLEDLLGRRVDLATEEMLHPSMKDTVLAEARDA